MKKGGDVIASRSTGKALAHGQLTVRYDASYSACVRLLRLSPIPMLLCNSLVPEFYDSLWAAPHNMQMHPTTG
jgi:hypothetical protein